MSILTAYDKFVQQALKYGFSLYGTPKTSQITVYQAKDDGEYQKGYPRQGPRFTDNGDGTITDHATGLMWVKNMHALGRSDNWQDAIARAEAYSIAGHNDWRLPNVKELASIIDYSREVPANDSMLYAIFTCTYTEEFWSSTTNKSNTAQAWGVYTGDGSVTKATKTTNGNPTAAVRLGYPAL